MKKLVFAIVAMFLLLGVSSSVTAQNPVRKEKTYPNGSFIKDRQYKLVLSNGTTIENWNYGNKLSVYNNNEKLAECTCKFDGDFDEFDLFKIAEENGFNSINSDNQPFLKMDEKSYIYIFCKDYPPADSIILNILKNKILPFFEMKKDGRIYSVDFIMGREEYPYTNIKSSLAGNFLPITIINSNEDWFKGRYYVNKDLYLSEDELIDLVRKDCKPTYDKILADIKSYTRKFGFDPTKMGIKNLIKVGRSFRLLKDYFSFMQKLNEIHIPNFLTNKNCVKWDGYEIYCEHPFLEEYYFFGDVSIDYGTRKCYDIYSSGWVSSKHKEGFVWVSGDKITSVVW